MATLSIPISKAGKGVFYDIDSEKINAMMEANPKLLEEALYEFFKVRLNAKMSKLPAPSKLEGAELEAAKEEALAKAAENLAEIEEGRVSSRSKASKSAHSKAELTEAIRQCKEVVKDKIKAAKRRVSTVAAKDITAAAKILFEQRREFYIAKAKAALAERAAEDTAEIDVVSLVKEDPKKVAKLEAEKAERKAQTSAKQAGLPKARAGKAKIVPPRRGDTPTHQTAH